MSMHTMNDKELVSWLRQEAEKQHADGCFPFGDKLDLAADRVEMMAGLLAACVLVLDEQTASDKTRAEFGGYVLDDYVASVVSAAVSKAKGSQ